MARFAFHCRDQGTVPKMHSNWLVKAMALNLRTIPTASRFVGMAARRLVTRPSSLAVRGHLYPQGSPGGGLVGRSPAARTHRCAVRRSTTAGENLLELVCE